jgi:hypothetical protein
MVHLGCGYAAAPIFCSSNSNFLQSVRGIYSARDVCRTSCRMLGGRATGV